MSAMVETEWRDGKLHVKCRCGHEGTMAHDVIFGESVRLETAHLIKDGHCGNCGAYAVVTPDGFMYVDA